MHPAYYQKLTQALVLDEKAVRAIWKTLERLGAPECQVRYDRISHGYRTLDSVLRASNTAKEPVRALAFSLHKSAALARADFVSRFGVPHDDDRIVYVTCPTMQQLQAVVRDMEEALDRCVPWYSFLARLEFRVLALPVGFAAAAIVFWSDVDPGKALTVGAFAKLLFVLLGAFVVSHASLSALNRIWSLLFPGVVVALGGGASRHRNMHVWRGVALSLLTGAVFVPLLKYLLWS